MKNKIVRIVVVLFSLILLVCPLFSIGASAYNSPISGIGINFTNSNNLPYGNISGLSFTLDVDENMDIGTTYFTIASGVVLVYTENGSQYMSVFGDVYSLTSIDIEDGVYQFIGAYVVDTGLGFIPSELEYYSSGLAELNGSFSNVLVYNGGGSINQSYDLFDGSMDITDNVILYNLDLPLTGGSGGETPTECPTLQEQIQDYNGTWAEFQGMMSTNSTLYEDFLEQKRTAYNDGIDVGQQDIITSINANNDFYSLMDTFLNYGMNNTRSVIEIQMDTVYQNGIARGNEDGFNDGYNRGYNKGTSEVFGENLLGETFNAPLEALNQWVLFETPGGIEVTMGGLFTAVIALAVLIIFLKMFAGG